MTITITTRLFKEKGEKSMLPAMDEPREPYVYTFVAFAPPFMFRHLASHQKMASKL